MRRGTAGFGLIEVLIALLIIMIGLLGLAGLQGRSLTAQMEAYQRGQAIVIAKNMVSRIYANSANVADYVTGSDYLGQGNDIQPTDCTGLTGQDLDFCEWHNLLRGSAETNSGGTNIGAIIGARGCIFDETATGGPYWVAVAWQGLTTTVAPPAAYPCGDSLYGTDEQHRLLMLPVTITDLTVPTPL